MAFRRPVTVRSRWARRPTPPSRRAAARSRRRLPVSLRPGPAGPGPGIPPIPAGPGSAGPEARRPIVCIVHSAGVLIVTRTCTEAPIDSPLYLIRHRKWVATTGRFELNVSQPRREGGCEECSQPRHTPSVSPPAQPPCRAHPNRRIPPRAALVRARSQSSLQAPRGSASPGARPSPRTRIWR